MIFDLYFVEPTAKADHDTRDTAITHNQIRTGANDRDWNIRRQIAQEICEVIFIFWHIKCLRRTADSKPDEFSERLIC
jgi:hypothetical protein